METASYAQPILALVFVLGLILGAGYLVRRFGPGGFNPPKAKSGDRRRLHVIESLPLDPRRRLLLIRRDGKEHLLLLGVQSDCVVEGDIPVSEETLRAEEPVKLAPNGVANRFDSIVRSLANGGRS